MRARSGRLPLARLALATLAAATVVAVVALQTRSTVAGRGPTPASPGQPQAEAGSPGGEALRGVAAGETHWALPAPEAGGARTAHASEPGPAAPDGGQPRERPPELRGLEDGQRPPALLAPVPEGGP